MFMTLLIKEIKLQILSARYVAGFTVLLLLIVGVTFALGSAFAKEQDNFRRAQIQREQTLDTYAHYNRIQLLAQPVQPPGRLGMFFSDQTSSEQNDLFFENPVYLLFGKFDLADVIRYVMAIMALVLAFDAISGEKEGGTLRLLSAFSVPRPHIVLAKAAAAVIIIIFPLAVASVISLSYLLSADLLAWGMTEYLALLSLLAVAVLHFFCFYAIGILCSAITARPSSSVILAFLIWVIFAFVIPNVSPFIAGRFFPVPAIQKVNAQVSALLDTERDELGRSLSRNVKERFKTEHPQEMGLIASTPQKDLPALLGRNPALKEIYTAFTGAVDSAWGEANRIQEGKARSLRDNLAAKIRKQQTLAQLLSFSSPSADLAYILEALSATGSVGYDHFADETRRFFGRFQTYVQEKYNEMKRQDPLFNNDSYLDIRDRPRFEFEEMAMGKRLAFCWIPLTLLALYSLMFFMAALFAFRRYDIR